MTAAIGAKPMRKQIDDASAAAVVVDDTGHLLEATAAAGSMLGRRPNDLVGRELNDLVVSGWAWVVRNAVLRLASGALDPFELLLRGRSGRRTLVHMIPHRLPPQPDIEGGRYMLVWLEQRQNAEIEPVSPSEAQLRRHAYALLSTHEAERGRVASELHDGVAPLIVMAKFMIEDALARLTRDAQQEAVELMRSTVTRLREALAEVRRISTELRPNSLDDLGLLPTIEWHCRIVSQTYEALHVTTDLAVEEATIPETLKLEIFRIVQESLNNVVRHARASEVKVGLRTANGRLELHVEDNGIGFEVEPVLRGEGGAVGLGLHNMRKRVDATRGSLRIDSSQWHGTRIDASWPLAPGGGDA